MIPLSLEELRELAPGFVMGTLTPDELAQFNGSLQDAATALALAPEIAAHHAAVEFLSTERAVTPPADLKNRMLARIAAESRDAAAAEKERALLFPTATLVEQKGAISPVARTVSPGRAVHVAPQATVRRASKAPRYGVGLLAIALAATIVFAVDLTNQVNSLKGAVNEKDALLKRIQARLAERDATVNTLTAAGAKLVLVQLAPTAPQGPGIQVFWNVKDGTAVIYATGLKQVAADRTYCLWMIRDGKPVAVKLFNPDGAGQRLINGVELPKNTQGIAAFAVTEEPAAGSPQPTMTPFLVGTVEAPKQ